jgi:hypothetical protein
MGRGKVPNRNMQNNNKSDASAAESAIVSLGEMKSDENFKDADADAILSAIAIEKNNILSSTQNDNSFNNKNEIPDVVRNPFDESSVVDSSDENSNNSISNNNRHYAYSKTTTSKNNNFSNTYDDSKKNILEILVHSKTCNFLSGK